MRPDAGPGVTGSGAAHCADVAARPSAQIRVAHLRQTLLWPLRLMPPRPAAGAPSRAPWQLLRDDPQGRWAEVVDEYDGDSGGFRERHYNEFVTFLPYVQRFLYGEGRARRGDDSVEADTPMRVFRRRDVARLRVRTAPGADWIELKVGHVDLYFFFDVDVVLLNVEVAADGLDLHAAQELLYRFGRAYPPGWDAAGRPQHSLDALQWLAADGSVLAESDSDAREVFMAHVSAHRAPRIAAHWSWLLAPLVADPLGGPQALGYRQIEYYRMPLMAYLAVDDPRAISRADWVRLGLVTGADEQVSVASTAAAIQSEFDPRTPYADAHLADFESRHVDDRYWCGAGAAPWTRYLVSGPALIVVGSAGSAFFRCGERGVLAQFRHQHFLLFLIAHFQKAALLMYSDKLVWSLSRLDVNDAETVKRFKRAIRGTFEGFLRFTHRYWFHEIAEQAHVRSLFRRTAQHLELDPLYAEVKERIEDMAGYLDADSLRRQANTVVRLTVVTIFGLIATITTGALGMNLLAEADASMTRRVVLFVLTLVVTTWFTLYTIARSKSLSDGLDVITDERLTWAGKWRALRRRPPAG